MKAEVKGTKLHIEIDLANDPKPSSTGKTLLCASDTAKLPAAFKGKELRVQVNATIKP